MKEAIRAVIADDYPLFREGIRLMLAKEVSIQIIGEATDGKELLTVIDDSRPDIVITDIEMPVINGIEATREIRKYYPGMGVIALTMFGEEHLIVDMLEAGANGYLLKSSKKEELVEAIEAVKEGETYFCNNTSMKLSKMIARRKPAVSDEVKFSEKELEIIKLICEQFASKQIASVTNLTHRTVEKYRDHIIKKTGARNVVGVVIYAIRHGLYKP